MQNKPAKFLDRWGRGLVLSVALHLIVLAVFLMKLPALPALPQEEESVAVELVPPPEEKPKPEEPKKEEEKKAEPPPPPPPPPVEEKKVEEPPPPMPTFVPVKQFGEKDTRPREDLRGDAEEEAVRPAETPPADQKPQATKAGETPDESRAEETAESAKQPADGGAPEEGETEPPTDQALALAAPPPPKPPKPVGAKDATKSETPLVAKPVKRLYSTSEVDDLVAMSTMAGESRGRRIGRLCATELGAQLLRASRPYVIYAYPIFNQESGNVLDAPRAAFGDVRGVWYNLAMRCTVDDDATRVVDFSFAVGEPVPRSEWKKRGFRVY